MCTEREIQPSISENVRTALMEKIQHVILQSKKPEAYSYEENFLKNIKVCKRCHMLLWDHLLMTRGRTLCRTNFEHFIEDEYLSAWTESVYRLLGGVVK